MRIIRLSFAILVVFLASCATPTPTPVVVLVTQEVVVTRKAESPTPAIIVVTVTQPPTSSPVPPTPSRATLSSDWVDFGGVCIRADNLPAGVQINSKAEAIQGAHSLLLAALWRAIDKSSSGNLLIPSFSNYSRFEQGVLQGIPIRGTFIPVGKTPPRSDPWSYYLEDAETIWRKTHPRGTFRGVDLSSLCIEFAPPFEFEEQKHLKSNPAYLHLVGGVSHAIFNVEEILGAPRLVINLYQNPYGGTRDYHELLGFEPANSAAENAKAANQHLSAVVVTLNTALWGNFDGDGVFEFGFGPANSKPLPVTGFQVIELFAPDS